MLVERDFLRDKLDCIFRRRIQAPVLQQTSLLNLDRERNLVSPIWREQRRKFAATVRATGVH